MVVWGEYVHLGWTEFVALSTYLAIGVACIGVCIAVVFYNLGYSKGRREGFIAGWVIGLGIDRLFTGIEAALHDLEEAINLFQIVEKSPIKPPLRPQRHSSSHDEKEGG
jgi:hypothetical protein